MTKKITLKTVKQMHKMWDIYSNIRFEEEQNKDNAYKEYLEYKKENFDFCTEIADDAVMELLKDANDIRLPSVEKISLIALKLIASTDLHEIELNGIKELTDEQVEALSGLRDKSRRWRSRNLCFASLTSLPSMFYFTFGRTNFKSGGELKLNGITQLTEGEEKVLSKFKFNVIELDGLKSITPNGFKQYKGVLSLGGLEEIPNNVVEGMAKWKMGGLRLQNLKKISVEFAKMVAQRTDEPYLRFGLFETQTRDKLGNWTDEKISVGPTLEFESIVELMKGTYHRISFCGIDDLTPEIAAELNKNPAMMDIYPLNTTKMNQDALKALSAKREGYYQIIYTSNAYIKRETGIIEIQK